MPTAFVVGATGYTGREVVRELRERGVTTYAHVRPDSSALPKWRETFGALGVEVDVTPFDDAAMRTTIGRIHPTHVFLLLGTTRKRAKDAVKHGGLSDYETVDYGYTMLVIRAAEALSPQPCLVYVSMLGVSASKNPYVSVRHRLEGHLRSGKAPYVIARPALISGEDRDEERPGERVAAKVIGGVLGLTRALGGKRMAERYGTLSSQALARGLVHRALDPASHNGVYLPDALRAVQ